MTGFVEGKRSTHPTVFDPLGTVVWTTRFRSIVVSNAYGRRVYTRPILSHRESVGQWTRKNRRRGHILSGQSSPGILHEGQQPSNGTRQIPQTSPSPSSSGSWVPVSQRHWAIACHFLMLTFIDASSGCTMDKEGRGTTGAREEGWERVERGVVWACVRVEC